MSKADENEVELGDLVQDRITGFTGICIATTDWLYGCRRATVQPRELNPVKDTVIGKPSRVPEGETFDVAQLAVVEKGAVPAPGKKMPGRKNAETTGGPMPNEHVALRR